MIVDYGVGNLFNLVRAFESLGAKVQVTQAKHEIFEAKRLLLPGVGAFGAGIQRLEELNLVEPLKDYAQSGRPLLGICLGMQLLMSESEELGHWKGLDLIQGKVSRFQPSEAGEQGVKVPQIGWNLLEAARIGAPGRGPIWKAFGIPMSTSYTPILRLPRIQRSGLQ